MEEETLRGSVRHFHNGDHEVTKWTEDEIETVRIMAALDCSTAKIAEALPGRSSNSVIGCCHRNNISLRKKYASTPFTNDERTMIFEMGQDGSSIMQIALVVGRSYPAISKYLRVNFGGIKAIQRRAEL